MYFKSKFPKWLEIIISTYEEYCREIGFTALSRASLFRILKVCKASKLKILQGPDNLTAPGLSAIETMLKSVSKMETKDLTDLLHIVNIVNQFLKYEYKSHLNQLDSCGYHCTTFALKDTSNNKLVSSFDHSHDVICDKCSMVSTFADLVRKEVSSLQIPSTILEEINYEIDSAESNVLDWKKHQLRTIHQDLSKKSILYNLASNQAFLIKDWAMKFLPFQFRESQSDFFGKERDLLARLMCYYQIWRYFFYYQKILWIWCFYTIYQDTFIIS